MSRSLKKWYYINERLLKKVSNMIHSSEKKVLKVRDRASQITPEMIWFTFAVHNGRNFTNVYVAEEMIWHRLWEFSPTRTFKWHPF